MTHKTDTVQQCHLAIGIDLIQTRISYVIIAKQKLKHNSVQCSMFMAYA